MKLTMLTKKNFALAIASMTILGTTLFPNFALADSTAVFLSGDIMTAGNRTTRIIDWGDPVDAKPGEVIEFRIVAQNTAPNSVARNVVVKASLPSTPATTLKASGTITADNAATVSDTVTVNVTGGEQQAFAYIPGHVRVFSKSCPSGCNMPDNILTSGIKVDDIAWGEGAQVLFKAYVTNTPPTTPTVTPTVVPTVTVTPTPVPQNNLQCPAGFVGAISGSTIICVQQSQQQSQTATGGSVNVTMTNPTPIQSGPTPAPVQTVSNVSSLPKTGLPLAAWAMSGLLPAGLGIKRFGKRSSESRNIGQYLWQEREYLKD
jgi:hypothetical protein